MRGAFRRARQRKSGHAVEHPELGGAEHALFLTTGDADADIAPLCAHKLLLVAPGAVVEHLQRHVEGAGIVAAVVEVAGRDLIGKFVRLDEIVAPELDRVEIKLVDGGIDDPLDHEVRHFGAETPAGALLAFVGEDGIDLRAPTARILYGPTVCEKPLPCMPRPYWK